MKHPDHKLRLWGYVAAAIIGAVVLMLMLSASGIQPTIKEDIPLADFAVVVLTALAVMMAVLTFFLGVLAFFGWTAFRTLIEDKFEELFRKRFDASNTEYGEIIQRLVEDARAQLLPLAANEELPENDQPPDHEPD